MAFLLGAPHSCYLGTLSSTTVVPEIRVENVSFRSLLEKNFSFTANKDATFRLSYEFGLNLDGHLTKASIMHEHLTAEALKDHVLLLSIIREKKFSEWKNPGEIRDFFKLESRVWMAERRDIDAVASLGRDIRHPGSQL